MAQISASIVKLGFTNHILAGHGRLSGTQKLGLDTVLVGLLNHLTPSQRRVMELIEILTKPVTVHVAPASLRKAS